EGANAWIAEQHERTEAVLRASGVEAGPIEARLDELSKIGGVGSARVAGQKTFYTKRTGEQEQSSLYVLEKGKERKLVDPGALDEGGKVALDWYHVSPSGRFVVYGLSRDGTEESV